MKFRHLVLCRASDGIDGAGMPECPCLFLGELWGSRGGRGTYRASPIYGYEVKVPHSPTGVTS